MIAVWPSRPGFGEQMAEAVLATALALPVIFAFAELRGTRPVGTATAPQLTDTPPNSSEKSAAQRPSAPVRAVLSGGSLGQTSVWDARLAVLMEVIRLTTHDASESAVENEAGPGTVNADEPAETIAERVPLGHKAGRSNRPTPAPASEPPSEAKR
jgi:hypothetical protein